MRVYIPATVGQLREVASGAWEPVSAFAVTDRMLEIAPDMDPDEAAEEVIHVAAMESALRLESPLRVVVAVDHPRSDIVALPGAHPAAVSLAGRVRQDTVVCLFVDEPEAEPDVAGALIDDEAALDRLVGRDLLWYDVSEIDAIALV
ncbi:hypothetical protein RN607_10880 [Demequina capsici]|uniref:Uncharacterized protein n=1 Tax=Demequina capsici TaxID=3075620 RepID=A0AA96F4F0_9MICO|nr:MULTISPECIES: hypothetical protein [unclassified Demequina]WNM23856.1 hypothetical protein RN606_10880 [Demequina sp. OYTSA14]WNM26695.1 hypothetical protein RN607_10880 [Demequina sp. PMTSA13]